MDWVMQDIKVFDPQFPSFFIVDNSPGAYRGIHTRFGAAGIIAESHYDGHRNFIAMLKGHKRYILNPPDQCGNLGVFESGPSVRHTFVDWSEPNKPSRGYHRPAPPEWYTARGVDVVLNPGDVLYVPSFYFHNPISLDRNMQANARSGVSPVGLNQISACGFGSGRSAENPATAHRLRERIASGDISLELEGLEAPGGKLALAGAVIEREGGRPTVQPRKGPGDPLLPIPTSYDDGANTPTGGGGAAPTTTATQGTRSGTRPSGGTQSSTRPAASGGRSTPNNSGLRGQATEAVEQGRLQEAGYGASSKAVRGPIARHSNDGGFGESPGMMVVVAVVCLAVIVGVFRFSRGRVRM